MQFMILFTLHPDKTETPVPAELREEEFQKVRGLYADGLVRQIWLRGDVRGACMIVEAASTDEAAEKLNALPLVRTGFLQPPMIVALNPYSGFAPRASSIKGAGELP
jgi:muconolactone delta-isomerase